jgi:hypothetical protein
MNNFLKPTLGNYLLSRLYKPLSGESRAEILIPPDLNIMTFTPPCIKIEDKRELYYNIPLSEEDINNIVEYIRQKIK